MIEINRIYRVILFLIVGMTFVFAFNLIDVKAESTESKVLNPETTITDDGEVYLITEEMLEKQHNRSGVDQQPSYFGSNPNISDSKKANIKNEGDDGLPDDYGAEETNNNYVPFKVIGPDNRYQINDTQTHPYRAVVQLRFKKPNGRYAICSGALIGPNTVLTAGHCLYSHGGDSGKAGWNKDFTVYPGRDGDLLPYGEYKVSKKISVTGWTQNKDYNYDYGVLKLKEEPKLGFFGFRKHTSIPEGLDVILTGYPSDKPTGTMWEGKGPLFSVNNNPYRVYYNIDTIGGQSGAPVYTENNIIRAVHSGYNSHGNRGTLINEAKYKNLVKWKLN